MKCHHGSDGATVCATNEMVSYVEQPSTCTEGQRECLRNVTAVPRKLICKSICCQVGLIRHRCVYVLHSMQVSHELVCFDI